MPADGVSAVLLNVTATEPSQASYLTVWPAGGVRPLASSLNFVAGQTVPNSVLVGVGVDGSVDLFNAFGSTHVVADVTGYALSPSDGLERFLSFTSGAPASQPTGLRSIGGATQSIPAASELVQITVNNRLLWDLTTNPPGYREDKTPAPVTPQPGQWLSADGLASFWSGARLSAYCWTRGRTETDGNNNIAADDPWQFTSNLRYGVALSDGRHGFISAVWTTKLENTLGLPDCNSRPTPPVVPPTSPPPPAPLPGVPTRTITVNNRLVWDLTTNPPGYIEDDTPAPVTPRADQWRGVDAIATFWSGAQLTAYCWTRGRTETDGNNNITADDPWQFTSSLRYGVSLVDKRTGFISAVWTTKAEDTLGLPDCSSASTPTDPPPEPSPTDPAQLTYLQGGDGRGSGEGGYTIPLASQPAPGCAGMQLAPLQVTAEADVLNQPYRGPLFVEAASVNGCFRAARLLSGKANVGGSTNAAHRWGNGLVQDFDSGVWGWNVIMLADGASQAFVVRTGMWEAYRNHDGMSALGYPISNEYDVPDGAVQLFERGMIVWSTSRWSATVVTTRGATDDYGQRSNKPACDQRYSELGYYGRNCTDFAAFRLQRDGHGLPYGAGGDAKYWATRIPATFPGWTADGTPRPGDIGVSTAGPWGHVVYVQAVNANGTVTIEQYNAGQKCTYSTATVARSNFTYLHPPVTSWR